MTQNALNFKQIFWSALPKGHIVAKMNWSRAKAPRPSLHKTDDWNPDDELGRKARRVLSVWKKRLPRHQRLKLDAALTR